MKFLNSFLTLLLLVCLSSCSAVSELVNSLDCDDFVLHENSTTLSDACRTLAGYLPDDTDTLTSLEKILPLPDLAETRRAFLVLTDASGAPRAVTSADVTAAVSSDGSTFTDVAVESVDALSEVETTQASLALVVDYSASILDDDLTEVTSGLNDFIDLLGVGYRGAVLKFSTDVTLIQDFTEADADLVTAVSDTSYERESTSLYDAIYEGVDRLKSESTALKLLVLFTDGMDNDSDHTQSEAVTYAQTNDVPVCIVGVSFADVATLTDIASDTGCFFVYKTAFSSLDTAFETLSNQINNLKMVSLPALPISSGTLRIQVTDADANVDTLTATF